MCVCDEKLMFAILEKIDTAFAFPFKQLFFLLRDRSASNFKGANSDQQPTGDSAKEYMSLLATEHSPRGQKPSSGDSSRTEKIDRFEGVVINGKSPYLHTYV